MLFNVLSISNYHLEINAIVSNKNEATQLSKKLSKANNKPHTFICPMDKVKIQKLINVIVLKKMKLVENEFFSQTKTQNAEVYFEKMIDKYCPGYNFSREIIQIAIDRGYLFLDMHSNAPVAIYFGHPKQMATILK